MSVTRLCALHPFLLLAVVAISPWTRINPRQTYAGFSNVVGDEAGNVIFLAKKAKHILISSSPPYSKWNDDQQFWNSQFQENITTIAHNGKGLFLAQGQSKSATSPDGVKWTVHKTQGSFVPGGAIVGGNGYFVSFNTNFLYYSMDGVTWHKGVKRGKLAPPFFDGTAFCHQSQEDYGIATVYCSPSPTSAAQLTLNFTTLAHREAPEFRGSAPWGGSGCPGTAQMVSIGGFNENSRDNYYLIARSTDGGKTWKLVRRSNGKVDNIVNPICLGGGTKLCWAFQGPELGGGSNLVSKDCGETWQESEIQYSEDLEEIGFGAGGQFWALYDNGNFNWTTGLPPQAQSHYSQGLPLKGPFGYSYSASDVVIAEGKLWVLTPALAHPDNPIYANAGLYTWEGEPGEWKLAIDLKSHTNVQAFRYYPDLQMLGISVNGGYGFVLYSPKTRRLLFECANCFKNNLHDLAYNAKHGTFIGAGYHYYGGPPEFIAEVAVGTWDKKLNNITDWKITLSTEHSKSGDGLVSNVVELHDGTLIVNWCLGEVSVLRYSVNCTMMVSHDGGHTWSNDPKYTVPMNVKHTPVWLRVEGAYLFASAAAAPSGCKGSACGTTYGTTTAGKYNSWKQTSGEIANAAIFALSSPLQGHNWVAAVNNQGGSGAWFLGDYPTGTWAKQPIADDTGVEWGSGTRFVSDKALGHFAVEGGYVWHAK